nr:MAG TPA: hypothetical protein [Caudoviricetes sp.]
MIFLLVVIFFFRNHPQTIQKWLYFPCKRFNCIHRVILLI